MPSGVQRRKPNKVRAILPWAWRRYDSGSGYPDGLADEQIPLGSRVISVCDTYPAMVSDRAYSMSMGCCT